MIFRYFRDSERRVEWLREVTQLLGYCNLQTDLFQHNSVALNKIPCIIEEHVDDHRCEIAVIVFCNAPLTYKGLGLCCSLMVL